MPIGIKRQHEPLQIAGTPRKIAAARKAFVFIIQAAAAAAAAAACDEQIAALVITVAPDTA